MADPLSPLASLAEPRRIVDRISEAIAASEIAAKKLEAIERVKTGLTDGGIIDIDTSISGGGYRLRTGSGAFGDVHQRTKIVLAIITLVQEYYLLEMQASYEVMAKQGKELAGYETK